MRRNARKSNSRSVNNGSENFLEGLELLRECGLQVEGDLKLGNCRTHLLPVVSGSSVSVTDRLLSPEDVRPEISACDLPIRDVLNRRPPLRLEEDLVLQPIGNGLLFEGGAVEKFGNPLGEQGLAPRDLDGAAQRSDVRLVSGKVRGIHTSRLYKCTCDSVNKYTGVTGNKVTCKVLYMPVSKRKALPDRAKEARKPKKPFPVGPDHKTANQRLRECLAQHPTIRTERDLVLACNQLAGRAEGEPDYVKQQAINNFLRDVDSLAGSQHVAVIAEALGIRAFWLQTGIGAPRNEDEDLLQQLYERRAKRQLPSS